MSYKMLRFLKKSQFFAWNFWNIDFFKIIQKNIKSKPPWLQNDIKKSWVIALNFTQKCYHYLHYIGGLRKIGWNCVVPVFKLFLRKIESDDPDFFLHRFVAKDV